MIIRWISSDFLLHSNSPESSFHKSFALFNRLTFHGLVVMMSRFSSQDPHGSPFVGTYPQWLNLSGTSSQNPGVSGLVALSSAESSAIANSARADFRVVPGVREASCEMDNAKLAGRNGRREFSNERMGWNETCRQSRTEWAFLAGGPSFTARAIMDMQSMSDAGWGTAVRMGWNGHEKHCEMVELIWRAKVGFPRLKIGLLHENPRERKRMRKAPGNADQKRWEDDKWE